MKNLLLLSIAILGVSCAGASYEQFSSFGSKGYKDAQLGGGKYEVSFFGNGLDDAMRVKTLFLRRSAEIAQQNNKKGFCIVEQNASYRQNGPSNWPYHQGIIKLSDKIDSDNCHGAGELLARAM